MKKSTLEAAVIFGACAIIAALAAFTQVGAAPAEGKVEQSTEVSGGLESCEEGILRQVKRAEAMGFKFASQKTADGVALGAFVSPNSPDVLMFAAVWDISAEGKLKARGFKYDSTCYFDEQGKVNLYSKLIKAEK